MKIEVKTEVKAETEGEVEHQEGEQVEPQEEERRRQGAERVQPQHRRSAGKPVVSVFQVQQSSTTSSEMTTEQMMARMQELVNRVQQAEARAGQAEQQAQQTQQVLAQMQQQQQQKGQMKGGNGRGYESGIGSFASKYQPPSFEGQDEKWKEWARVFRSWSGRFYDGELGVVYEHIESKRNESAGISDLRLSLVSGREEKLRAMASEFYHVLVMLTRGRAQKLVLKAGEPEGFEAYRLLLRRYEPQTTATTVTKLVELLSTQFAGDLLDCVTDLERRAAVWESEAGEQLSDLIKIGVVVKGLEKGNFRDHLLINTSGTKQWSRFIKEIEAVELARLNSRPTPMDLSAVGHDQPKRFEWCGTHGHVARDCSKKAAAQSQR